MAESSILISVDPLLPYEARIVRRHAAALHHSVNAAWILERYAANVGDYPFEEGDFEFEGGRHSDEEEFAVVSFPEDRAGVELRLYGTRLAPYHARGVAQMLRGEAIGASMASLIHQQVLMAIGAVQTGAVRFGSGIEIPKGSVPV